jgi:hypothetical protein
MLADREINLRKYTFCSILKCHFIWECLVISCIEYVNANICFRFRLYDELSGLINLHFLEI